MNQRDRAEDDRAASELAHGVRLDLIIAVCALLISSLAAGATWWQVRVLQAQTSVLQEQLGAQVWPYVSTSANESSDSVRISIENDGLGPAVLRSFTATIDGKPESNFIDIMHGILGPNLIARSPHGESLRLGINGNGPGWVLRAGASTNVFTLISKRYAAPFALGASRLDFRLCYCAIIPGKCWLSDSASSRDPAPIRVCRSIPNDLLHGSPVQLLNRKF